MHDLSSLSWQELDRLGRTITDLIIRADSSGFRPLVDLLLSEKDKVNREKRFRNDELKPVA